MSQLIADLEAHTSRYVEAFNAGDFTAVDGFYTPEAIAVWEPGKPLTGESRRVYQREFLARRPKMTATPRQTFVTGNTALMIVDWVIESVDDYGTPERLKGIGVDVLTLGDDGLWRYAIDDPYGQN